jgi:hypothetical protein
MARFIQGNISIKASGDGIPVGVMIVVFGSPEGFYHPTRVVEKRCCFSFFAEKIDNLQREEKMYL